MAVAAAIGILCLLLVLPWSRDRLADYLGGFVPRFVNFGFVAGAVTAALVIMLISEAPLQRLRAFPTDLDIPELVFSLSTALLVLFTIVIIGSTIYARFFGRPSLPPGVYIKVGGGSHSPPKTGAKYKEGDLIRPTETEVRDFGDLLKTPTQLATERRELKRENEQLNQKLNTAVGVCKQRENDVETLAKKLSDLRLQCILQLAEHKQRATGSTCQAIIQFIDYADRGLAESIRDRFTASDWECIVERHTGKELPPEGVRIVVQSGAEQLARTVHGAFDQAKSFDLDFGMAEDNSLGQNQVRMIILPS